MRNAGKRKKNIFGKRLKILRESVLGKTQKELSELLGIPQPTLSSYENGRNIPTIDVAIHIAEKCNISLDWLCGRDHYVQAKGKESSDGASSLDKCVLHDLTEHIDALYNYVHGAEDMQNLGT